MGTYMHIVKLEFQKFRTSAPYFAMRDSRFFDFLLLNTDGVLKT